MLQQQLSSAETPTQIQPELWNVIVCFITVHPFSGNSTWVKSNFSKHPSSFTCFLQTPASHKTKAGHCAAHGQPRVGGLTCGTPSQSSACCMASRALSTGFFGSQLSQSGHKPANTFQLLCAICQGASLAEETKYKLQIPLHYAALQKDIQSFAEVAKTRQARAAYWNNSKATISVES